MFWLLGLWVVPIVAFLWAKYRLPTRVGLLTGVSLGAIVSSASLGLYALFYTNTFLATPGLIGLALSLIHGSPGYHLALELGVVPPGVVVQGSTSLWVELLNALVWSGAYGMAGSALDWARSSADESPADESARA